jgi:cardiolipin synthase
MSFSWIPNAISLMRIALIAPILVLAVQGEFAWSLVLFFIAGFSDGVDGYIARRFDWHSRLGGLLDPVADKLLMTGVFITLAWIELIPAWLAAVVILRDLVIVGGAIAYSIVVKPTPAEPTRISKVNTALQILYVLFVMSQAAFGWPDEISTTILGAAVLATVVISGVDYVRSWSQRARKGE